jgi:hypothetical protein
MKLHSEENNKKEVYSEPLLIQHGALLDITAASSGGGAPKSSRPPDLGIKFDDPINDPKPLPTFTPSIPTDIPTPIPPPEPPPIFRERN